MILMDIKVSIIGAAYCMEISAYRCRIVNRPSTQRIDRISVAIVVTSSAGHSSKGYAWASANGVSSAVIFDGGLRHLLMIIIEICVAAGWGSVLVSSQ